MFWVSLLEEQREEQTQAENRIFLALFLPSMFKQDGWNRSHAWVKLKGVNLCALILHTSTFAQVHFLAMQKPMGSSQLTQVNTSFLQKILLTPQAFKSSLLPPTAVLLLPASSIPGSGFISLTHTHLVKQTVWGGDHYSTPALAGNTPSPAWFLSLSLTLSP